MILDLWYVDTLRQINTKLARSRQSPGDQIIKLAEELGEAVDEYLDSVGADQVGPEAGDLLRIASRVGSAAKTYVSVAGTNPRKPKAPNADALAKELADVVMTALVGIVSFGYDPNQLLQEQIDKAMERYHASP